MTTDDMGFCKARLKTPCGTRTDNARPAVLAHKAVVDGLF